MTDEPYYLRGGSHVLITGATGAGDKFGGKTALGNWWFSEAVRHHKHPEIGVFFNPKGEGYIQGKRVTKLSELKRYLGNGVRVFNVVPPGDPTEAHSALIDFLRRIRGTKIVAHDEAHEYSDSELLSWSVRQGGNISNSTKWNSGDIQSLVITQHPWDIGEKTVQNCPLKVWVGPVTNEAQRYFAVMQIPSALDKVRAETGRHKWSVIDGGEYVETNAPVPEKFAGT